MTAQDLSHVPGRAHYGLKYFRGGRIFSYAHQIDTVLSFEPRRVLEVGVGAGVVAAALRAIGIEVATVDIQPELGPDIVGSVTNLPVDDGAFDVALCCQVLEHLPFEHFVPSLREIRRVVRSGAVISLPDVRRSGYVIAKLPKIPTIVVDWTMPRIRFKDMPQSRFEGMGHYWELGYRGYSAGRVLGAVRDAGWRVSAHWRVREMPWHHFYRLLRER